MKAPDAAKAGVLRQAAECAQCAAHLGIVHIGESGAAEAGYVEYSYRSRRKQYRDRGSRGEDDDEGASFTVITVDNAWQYVDEWRDTKDRPVEFGPIPLAAGELLPEGALDGEPPDKKRLTEASGNEGASYERSYHRAALVLWRRDRYAEVLLQAGVVAALPYLKELTAGGSRLEALALAERIVETWPADARRWASYSAGGGRPGPAHRVEMVTALAALGSADLLDRFVAETVTPRYDGSENAAILSAVAALGDEKAPAVLSALVSTRMPGQPRACAELLLGLSGDPSRCFPEVAEAAVAALDRIGAEDAGTQSSAWAPVERRPPLGPEFLVSLFEALPRFPAAAFREIAADKVAARPEAFSPVTLVVPALEQIHSAWGREAASADRSLTQLWTRSAEFLLGRSEIPPEPPSDWRLDVKLSCSCADCRDLQAFALDPAAQVHRFRVKQERRQHLHGAIEKHRLDMTHVTERVGSPQTLVCTKDRRTFDGRMKQYRQEIAAMRALIELVPASDVAPALAARMQAAVKLAGSGNP